MAIALAESTICSAETLFPEPDKDNALFINDLFNIKCPATDTKKNIYLCALKMINKSPEDNLKSKESLLWLSSTNITDAKYSLFISRKSLKISDQEAVTYLIDAAEKELPKAQLELSRLYLRGEILQQNSEKSYRWVKKSAEGNNYEAMRYLSKYYFSGTGVEKNDTLGFFWLKKLYSNYGPLFDDWGLLGRVYETGRGTPIDLVKAYMCYDLDGTAGIEEKARIAPKMTSEQRAEGLRLSREWQEKNHVYTMQSLGLSRQKDGSYR